MRLLATALCLLFFISVTAQKKPLDHTMYDQWESIGERVVADNGQWIAFVKAVQEGDNELIIRAVNSTQTYSVPRGYNPQFTADGRYAVALVRPFFSATREARIKKKKPEDFPKDSICVINLVNGGMTVKPNIKAYTMPKHTNGLIAVHMHNTDTARRGESDEGSNLVVATLGDTSLRIFRNISEYKWSKNGKILVMEGRQARSVKGSMNSVMVYRSLENKLDTIARGGNEFSNFDIDSNAYQIAFVAERDSSAKALQKFYKLWHWRNGTDSAVMLADKNIAGMRIGWTVSEHGATKFSDSGDRLFFGTAPIRPAKDTSVPEIDQVKLDIWNYKDDYLQTQQLYNLSREQKRNYLAMFDLGFGKMQQLGDENMRDVVTNYTMDGNLFVGVCDTGRRIQSQWTGEQLRDVYAIDLKTGQRTLVTRNLTTMPQLSAGGKYIFWFDEKARQYFTWKDGVVKNISAKVPTKLYDEEYDMPSDPSAFGVARWLANDAALLVYDRYDIWQLDPDGVKTPVNVTNGQGRKQGISYRYVSLDPEERFIDPSKSILLRTQRDSNKYGGLATLNLSKNTLESMMEGPYLMRSVDASKNGEVLAYSKESFQNSPDLYVRKGNAEQKLSALNPHQSAYSWGSVELVSWKAYDGKISEGMLFKPEGFDGTKKYPMICYFYERDAETLFAYRAPAPTPSRLDITFFVSRGYVVFVPDIHYKTGYPGKSAYDYVVSGARAMVKKGGIDSTKIGVQGQSWGGYQLTYLITRTKLFAAAWAGAPVANMTSAYGGIRWESGLNRQFQYEKSQSRIGATLWEKQNLYIENSPLFYVPRIITPLVIMSNDADGAVPWYQGIEMFTAMRRLGKKVWLLNYNGEAHNLVQRKNRKDISIREQQFFDWLLKGEKPPAWITNGVPAVDKGITLGLD
jgi:dipeptidyl aminopeptidase/acylaminoacyl peptidase